MSETKPQRRIKSFVLRQGRMSQRQQDAMERFWPEYGMSVEDGLLDFRTLFRRQAPTWLEIGFGMGGSLVQMLEKHSEVNFIGVEVHRPGVGALLADAGEKGFKNLRVFQEDVNRVLAESIPDESLERILIFFPDPWPKRRHHKRRLVQPEFIKHLRKKLKPGGLIHCATDWEDYAQHMMSVLSSAPGFINVVGEGVYSKSVELRPSTKFEQRGEKLGHGVWDLCFKKEN